MQCEDGCCFNWTSAKPLPGRPAASQNPPAEQAGAAGAGAGAAIDPLAGAEPFVDDGIARLSEQIHEEIKQCMPRLHGAIGGELALK